MIRREKATDLAIEAVVIVVSILLYDLVRIRTDASPELLSEP